MQKIESVLHFKKYSIIETNCKISPDGITSNDIDLKLGTNVGTLEDGTIRSNLSVTITNNTSDIEINVTISGDFELSNPDSIPLKQIDYFKESSTIAILFPYVRSYITFLTSEMGIMPIQLPIFNVAEAVKKEKDSQEV